MQLRVDSSGSVVTKCGGNDVACKTIMSVIFCTHPSRSIVFKFLHGSKDSFVMSFYNSFVTTNESGYRYRLRWSDSEVIKNAPICFLFKLGKELTSSRVETIAKGDEVIFSDIPIKFLTSQLQLHTIVQRFRFHWSSIGGFADALESRIWNWLSLAGF